MAPDLLALIKAYQQRAAEAVRLLNQTLHLEHPNQRRAAGIPMTGTLGQTGVRYAFHGIGVALYFPGRTIDIDFGYEGRFDGFDAWRLAGFAKSLGPKFLRFKGWQEVEKELADCLAEGSLQQNFLQHQDRLYYLKDEV